VKSGLGESRRSYGSFANRDLNLAATGRRFGRDPRLIAPEKDEQGPLGSRMFERDRHQGFDEPAEDDFPRHRL
jgi:hypothetical protein